MSRKREGKGELRKTKPGPGPRKNFSLTSDRRRGQFPTGGGVISFFKDHSGNKEQNPALMSSLPRGEGSKVNFNSA